MTSPNNPVFKAKGQSNQAQVQNPESGFTVTLTSRGHNWQATTRQKVGYEAGKAPSANC